MENGNGVDHNPPLTLFVVLQCFPGGFDETIKEEYDEESFEGVFDSFDKAEAYISTWLNNADLFDWTFEVSRSFIPSVRSQTFGEGETYVIRIVQLNQGDWHSFVENCHRAGTTAEDVARGLKDKSVEQPFTEEQVDNLEAFVVAAVGEERFDSFTKEEV